MYDENQKAKYYSSMWFWRGMTFLLVTFFIAITILNTFEARNHYNTVLLMAVRLNSMLEREERLMGVIAKNYAILEHNDALLEAHSKTMEATKQLSERSVSIGIKNSDLLLEQSRDIKHCASCHQHPSLEKIK